MSGKTLFLFISKGSSSRYVGTQIIRTLDSHSLQLNGAKVLLINGLDPYVSVNANTLITGSYQAYGTRQNAYVLPQLLLGERVLIYLSTDSSRVTKGLARAGITSWGTSLNSLSLLPIRFF